MTEELTRLHRSTALHIQRQLSARPKAGNFVAHPLDFLRERPSFRMSIGTSRNVSKKKS